MDRNISQTSQEIARKKLLEAYEIMYMADMEMTNHMFNVTNQYKKVEEILVNVKQMEPSVQTMFRITYNELVRPARILVDETQPRRIYSDHAWEQTMFNANQTFASISEKRLEVDQLASQVFAAIEAAKDATSAADLRGQAYNKWLRANAEREECIRYLQPHANLPQEYNRELEAARAVMVAAGLDTNPLSMQSIDTNPLSMQSIAERNAASARSKAEEVTSNVLHLNRLMTISYNDASRAMEMLEAYCAGR